MKVLDLLNAPWAIEPAKLIEMQEIYLRRTRGDNIDLAQIEARIGKPLNNDRIHYEVIEGVAVIPIEGVLSKRMNLFTAISGGASTQLLAQDFQAALRDPTAHSILFAVDSPGGEVDGSQEIARMIREARGHKPMVTLASGRMGSAAYWIGSAAEKVFLSSETTLLGSIGIVARHLEVSKRDEILGQKETLITAGKYKALASEHQPLSEEGRAYLQDVVDRFYTVLVNEVARNRGVAPQAVLDRMADGRIFIGQQAIDIGLGDGFATQEELIAQLNQKKLSARPLAASAEAQEETMEQSKQAPSAAEFEKERSTGAASERQRILAVQELGRQFPGQEALVEQCITDGSTPEQSSYKLINAEKANRAAALNDLRAGTPKPVRPPAGQETAAPLAYNPFQLGQRARHYREEMMAKGVALSAQEAFVHVLAESGLPATSPLLDRIHQELG